MTELFIVVGAVSVAAAALMLLSDNAVHSALYLILNFASVAFLYLMLDAPFLAMVQIAVYAGAIMVLFLFVIMLLGADRSDGADDPTPDDPSFTFHTPLALILSLVLLLTVGIALGQGGVDSLRSDGGDPMLRVSHYAPDAGPVDVYANGELLLQALRFQDTTDFLTVSVGEYTVELVEAEANEVVLSATVALEQGAAYTALAYGRDAITVTLLEEDLSQTEPREGRLTVFNAYTQAVMLEDIGRQSAEGDEQTLIESLAPGTISEALMVQEGELAGWRFVLAGDPESQLFRLRDTEIERDTSNLVVVTNMPSGFGAAGDRADVTVITAPTALNFGSPEAVGRVLFVQYLLPFEVVALLLLAALVGVIVLTQTQAVPVAAKQRPRRRKVSRPLTSVIANQVGSDLKGSTPQLTSGEEPSAGD